MEVEGVGIYGMVSMIGKRMRLLSIPFHTVLTFEPY